MEYIKLNEENSLDKYTDIIIPNTTFHILDATFAKAPPSAGSKFVITLIIELIELLILSVKTFEYCSPMFKSFIILFIKSVVFEI